MRVKKEVARDINDIHQYSINLMWISVAKPTGPGFFRSDKQKCSSIIQTASKEQAYLKSVRHWAETNPLARVNLWYDSSTTVPVAIEATKLSFSQQNNIHVRNIREIPIVSNNPDIFSSGVPIYFRVDILKCMIIIDAIEREKYDAAVFCDFEVGNLRGVDKPPRMTKEELFDQETMQQLNQCGLVVGKGIGPFENQFLQLINHPHMLEALKHVVVNLSLVRATKMLNEQPDQVSSGLLNEAVFLAMLSELGPYFAFLEAQDTLHIIDTTNNNVIIESYDAKKHGYAPFGLIVSKSQFCNRYLKYDHVNTSAPAIRDASVRQGHGHGTDSSCSPKPPTSGERFECQLLETVSLGISQQPQCF